MAIMVPAWVNGTLQPVEKLAAHERGLRHMAVSVFVLSGREILLQQRALGKYHTPGLWANTCCTHPEWDEAAEDCAQRRLEEELGITGLSLSHRGQVEYRADVGGGLIEHEVVDVFVAHASRDIPMRPAPDEVMATRWTDHADLLRELDQSPETFTPWLRIYLAEHDQLILGDDIKRQTPQ
tara:strand:+ start:24746 stop:25288 length:543 start_codon:yes stop_codon:yes gene_type:complete